MGARNGRRQDVQRSLVEQSAAGDQQAFEALVRQSAGRLFAIAYRILRDHDRAEDALQQALVTIWDELPRLRDPDRFEAWSYRLIVRASIAQAKRERRGGAVVHLLPDDAVAGTTASRTSDEIDAVADRDQVQRGVPALEAGPAGHPRAPALRRPVPGRDRRCARESRSGPQLPGSTTRHRPSGPPSTPTDAPSTWRSGRHERAPRPGSPPGGRTRGRPVPGPGTLHRCRPRPCARSSPAARSARDPEEGSHEHPVLPVRGCPSTALPRRHPGAGPRGRPRGRDGGRPLPGPVGRGSARRDAIADAHRTAPSGSAPASPSPSPSSPTAISVDLIENVGADATIDIIDLSGTLVGAVSGIPPDGANDPVRVTGLAAEPGDDHPDLERPAVRHDPPADDRTRWAEDDDRAARLPGRRPGHLPCPGADVRPPG